MSFHPYHFRYQYHRLIEIQLDIEIVKLHLAKKLLFRKGIPLSFLFVDSYGK